MTVWYTRCLSEVSVGFAGCAALVTHHRSSMTVWYTRCLSEVSVGFAGCAGTLHDDSVLSLGGLHCQLVEGHDLSTSLQHASTCTLGHVQATDLQLRQIQNAHIIRNCADDHSNLIFTARLLHVTHNTSNRHGWSVSLAHEESLQHDLVKLRIGTTGQE